MKKRYLDIWIDLERVVSISDIFEIEWGVLAFDFMVEMINEPIRLSTRSVDINSLKHPEMYTLEEIRKAFKDAHKEMLNDWQSL